MCRNATCTPATHGLQIHIPQCKEKFIAQQKLLPPAQRKKLPKPPQLATASAPAVDASGVSARWERQAQTSNTKPDSHPQAPLKASQMTAAQLEAMNQAAYETYNTEVR